MFLRHRAEGTLLTPPPPSHFLPVPPASPSPGFDAKGGAFCSALKSYWVISCGGGKHLDFQRKSLKEEKKSWGGGVGS